MLNSLFDHIRVVIRSITGLRPFHASLLHKLLWNIEVEHHLGLAYALLEELCLINGSREAINNIALQVIERHVRKQSSYLNLKIAAQF